MKLSKLERYTKLCLYIMFLRGSKTVRWSPERITPVGVSRVRVPRLFVSQSQAFTIQHHAAREPKPLLRIFFKLLIP